MTNPQDIAKQELAKRELSRRRFLDFIKYNFERYEVNWHHKKIIDALERVERGELKRLMILMPPRFGKSEIASIQFPAWFIGRKPTKEIIAVSYNAELSIDFGRKTRNLVRSKEFSNIFRGIKLSEDSTAAGKWNVNEGGSYIATGVGGAITGRGADILIIDDPVKNREEAESELIKESVWGWYRSTARTRLNPGGAIILIQTRWAEDDLAGRILEREQGWEVIKFPAIATEDEEFRKVGESLWPSRYPLEDLNAIKGDIGPYDWSSLFQQVPVDVESQEFKRQWFRYIDQEEVSKKNIRKILTVDTALSKLARSDYTGFCHNEVDTENFWYFKTWKSRIDPHQLVESLFALHTVHRYEKIGIEKTSYTDGLKPYIDSEQRKRNMFLPIVELRHGGVAKEVRIRGLIPRYSSGSIFHIEGQCDDLESELLMFPKGKHDDVVDAAAYQLQIVSYREISGFMEMPHYRSNVNPAV